MLTIILLGVILVLLIAIVAALKPTPQIKTGKSGTEVKGTVSAGNASLRIDDDGVSISGNKMFGNNSIRIKSVSIKSVGNYVYYNGMKFRGSNISVVNNKVYVDGKLVTSQDAIDN